MITATRALSILFFLSSPTFAHTIDGCARFLELRQSRTLHADAVRAIRDSAATVVLIPGFQSDAAAEGGNYFNASRDAYRAAGIPVIFPPESRGRALGWDSENLVERNALVLSQLLATIPGNLILVSHSKGGTDALHLLLTDSEVAGRVATNVSIQTPYEGSELASLVARNRLLHLGGQTLATLFGGHPHVFFDLSVERRRAYMREWGPQIVGLTRRIRFVSHGSSVLSADGQPVATILGQGVRVAGGSLSAHGLMVFAGAKPANDGVVSVESALLDGTCTVQECGVDHLMTVMAYTKIPGLNAPYDRVALTDALILLGLGY